MRLACAIVAGEAAGEGQGNFIAHQYRPYWYICCYIFSPGQVVFREGIFVRSSSSTCGRIVRIAAFETVLKATGRVRGSETLSGVGLLSFAVLVVLILDAPLD